MITKECISSFDHMPHHLLGIEHFTKERLLSLLDNAASLLEIGEREIKKVPTLRGKTVINLFLEPSTRTRTSFEIAAKRLSADAINISESGSSAKKGETLLDTAKTLEAMSPDIIVVRHKESGASKFLAKYLKDAAIVNAGDGMNEHPSQALLDCLTIKKQFGSLSGLTVAIVGDVRHSRVARSNLFAHALLGSKVRLVGPPTLVPNEFQTLFKDTVTVHRSLDEGIEGADVIICLRIQLERQAGFFIPSLDEYSRWYCLTRSKVEALASKALVMHPGPVNRGVEISSDLLDTEQCVVSYQVKSGVAVRMAILLDAVVKRG
jgi:aspartate carbamoyltransferase catalytic subunit